MHMCSVHCSSSFLPVPICPILSLCVFVFGVYGLMCFLKFMCLFVLCSCFNTRTYFPSSALPSITPKPTFMHPFTAISLFLARVKLYRERGNHQKLWQKNSNCVRVSITRVSCSQFGKTASPYNFSCLECLP